MGQLFLPTPGYQIMHSLTMSPLVTQHMTYRLLLKGCGQFPYLRRMEDFPYPLRYMCKAGTSDIKPKFGMYYGVPAHEECSLSVSTLGIIQGGIHSEGVCAIYAQEVRDMEGSFCWTTTKTCMWCNKAFSNGESAMNHMHAHYWIMLVCPFYGMLGSHSCSSMREHVK